LTKTNNVNGGCLNTGTIPERDGMTDRQTDGQKWSS